MGKFRKKITFRTRPIVVDPMNADQVAMAMDNAWSEAKMADFDLLNGGYGIRSRRRRGIR